uniref:R13L1/DRL21-like LRR repeat region domain-containing protein n=1 Tax=Quercus lobata TaxID=97700 RepID=A0A7N2MUA5_QUELO
MYDEDEKVLEGLQPHPNLKSLTIEWYLGKKFPSWVGLSSLYHNLIEINLRYCRECEEVPTLGQLPYLRVLEITGMGKVRCIGRLIQLRDLPDSLHTYVSLQKLVVEDCPKLRSLPSVQSIIRCGIEDPPSGLQCVEYLENGDCRLPSTSSIHPSLQKLKLREPLHSLLDQIQYFIALKILWIEGFHEIGALLKWLGNLSSLQKLYFVDCKNLVHLPTKEAMRRLTQLKMLEIYHCPNLEDNELSKIDHVPFVNIKDSG